MTDTSSAELARVQANLVEMTELVESAMRRATHSLLTADIRVAEAVISEDLQIDAINNTVETNCLDILTNHRLGNNEVRSAIACLRMSTTLERMGDLAAHVAKQARMRYPHVSIPAELQGTFARMGELANEMVQRTGKVISTQDLAWASDMATVDAEMDKIHRELFATVLSPEWQYGVEAAIDVTLLSRYYERFADHGLTIARRVAFVVKGEPYGISDLRADD